MQLCATRAGIAGVLLVTACGCNPGARDDHDGGRLPDVVFFSEPGGPPPFEGGPLVHADIPPPPISGGTLAVAPDAAIAVAADPDLDSIFVVDLATRAVVTIELPRGAQPGRVVLDGAGRAHVVLRGAGAIADVEIATAAWTTRAVCAVPRGIAWRAGDDTLHVACAEGLLVTLPAAGGDAIETLRLADDLRDVIVAGDDRWVTRFRSAAVLRVDASGAVTAELAPTTSAISAAFSPAVGPGRFEPAVAWRAIPDGDGVLLLHQRAVSAEVVSGSAAFGAYGAAFCGSGIVHAALTSITAGSTATSSAPLAEVVLGVDVAISPDGSRFAIASPANRYRRFSTFGAEPSGVIVLDRAQVFSPERPDDGSCVPVGLVPPVFTTSGAPVAVAFTPAGNLIAQTRAPAELVFDGGVAPITLSSRSAYDTGHTVFHGRARGMIACASCHPEGGDDGRTWRFAGVGPRRTQTVRGGILDTAPFHWDGDMVDFDQLVRDVFVARMSGELGSTEDVTLLASWLDAQPALPRPIPSDPDAVERGRALFHDPAIGCASCHAGQNLTNDATVDVGTGAALQVPTLIGIAYRAPYLHDGCAATLRDRFGPCGGGDRHGHTSELGPAQIDDLVAYLRTL